MVPDNEYRWSNMLCAISLKYIVYHGPTLKYISQKQLKTPVSPSSKPM